VVIKPLTIPKLSFNTLATGAKQLVVQEAMETTLSFLGLYFSSFTYNQPTWWDEGDYLAVGKEIALPSPERTEWWGHFAGMRPPLMPLVWALFIKFGILVFVRFLLSRY